MSFLILAVWVYSWSRDNDVNPHWIADKYPQLLEEMPRVRAELGYPPLVTPTSSYAATNRFIDFLTSSIEDWRTTNSTPTLFNTSHISLAKSFSIGVWSPSSRTMKFVSRITVVILIPVISSTFVGEKPSKDAWIAPLYNLLYESTSLGRSLSHRVNNPEILLCTYFQCFVVDHPCLFFYLEIQPNLCFLIKSNCKRHFVFDHTQHFRLSVANTHKSLRKNDAIHNCHLLWLLLFAQNPLL